MEAKQLLRSLRESSKYSDLTLVCGLQMHKVHRNVMCSASSWFDNACGNEVWKETKEGIIKLESAFARGEAEDVTCDNPDTIPLFVDFIYLGDYTAPSEQDSRDAKYKDRWKYGSKGKSGRREKRWIPAAAQDITPNDSPKDTQLATHARMYAMGSKYFVESLNSAAVAEYLQAFEKEGPDANDLAVAISIVVSTGSASDCGMRDCVFESILEGGRELATNKAVKEAIAAVDELAFDLLARGCWGGPRSKGKGAGPATSEKRATCSGKFLARSLRRKRMRQWHRLRVMCLNPEAMNDRFDAKSGRTSVEGQDGRCKKQIGEDVGAVEINSKLSSIVGSIQFYRLYKVIAEIVRDHLNFDFQDV